MSNLILIHQLRNVQEPSPISKKSLSEKLEMKLENLSGTQVVYWSTCLREMAFVSIHDIHLLTTNSYQVFSEADAFRFLLEIVCGLQSPLLGETEVQGQFKDFVAKMAETHPEFWGLHSSFFQSVLAESKRVRTVHLKNIGSSSYGSLLRKRLQAQSEVAILGAGHLAKELLPWLKHMRKVFIYARSPEKVQYLQQTFPNLEIKSFSQKPEVSTLVIAAPMGNEDIIHWMKDSAVQSIYDLRGESSLNPHQVQKYSAYEPFSQWLEEMQQEQKVLSLKVVTAKEDIQKCSEAFARKSISRPGGWEDLCG